MGMREQRRTRRRFYERHKERMSQYWKTWRRKKTEEIIQKLGGRCKVCKESNIRYLQFHYKKGGKHPRYKAWILKHIKDFKLLCANHHNELTVYKEIL